MLKRLIEVALPLKEVSEQSAREKSIRHGHISTLHIWWARRPLAACRAVVFSSLIPDPDDPECPETFRSLVRELLARAEFKPKGEANGELIADTPRNRCLEFIKHLVRWENSNNPEYIEPARKLIAAAHKFLHPNDEGDAPKVLDPFAGGGAIPLEVLRLGCDAHAIDLNPVAHLIELCTLVYPQKYGQPDSRPVPDYIKRLIAHNRAKKKAKEGSTLFDIEIGETVSVEMDDIVPDVEVTEAEYRKNPLAADVKYWGNWVLENARREIGQFYPPDPEGSLPVAYLWARTVKCPNPQCGASIPLLRQSLLCKQAKRVVALKLIPLMKEKQCRFEVVEGQEIDFDPTRGTMKRGDATCPFCQQVAAVKYLREECRGGRMRQQLMASVTVQPGRMGKLYRSPTTGDQKVFQDAADRLEEAQQKHGINIVPQEPLPPVGTLGFRVNNYGLTKWGDLFNARQALALRTLGHVARKAISRIQERHDPDYATAVGSVLGVAVSRFADFNSSLCIFNYTGGRGVKNTFGRQALPMVWDYAESTPFNPQGANWFACFDAAVQTILKIPRSRAAQVVRGNAVSLSLEDGCVALVATDPPYYDAVPYADLSDFFYVWLKRTLSDIHPDLFRTPLTPKRLELVSHLANASRGERKNAAEYESGMAQAFGEMYRVLDADGTCAVMFAHKTTAAWETIISALIRAGLILHTSWPFHTERPGRLRAQESAALASSVTLVCRKRHNSIGDGLWDDVRKELQQVAKERLDFFWTQGIRGADFFISAIGPALSVFSQYERVTKLSGEEVTVGQFLDEVRGLVTNYALAKILKTTHTGNIDPESRFYVVWKWSYIDAKVPADEAFKLAQALGTVTETMWDRTGVLEKAGENVQAVPIAKRMKIKDLGEPNTDSSAASLIDVLHRMCAFREKGDAVGMAEFLARSGQGKNPTLWLVAQAVSEILPDGAKEKQLMQGLLNQREKLEQEQGLLF